MQKQLVNLAKWAKGVVTAMSRTDLPPDTLAYAENVDFTIPDRQRLLENDAVIGDGGAGAPHPDHNAVADSVLDWGWLDGTPAVGSFADMGRFSFAGEEYIYKVAATGEVYIQKVSGEAAWAELDFGSDVFDATKRPYSDGESVHFPLAESSGKRRMAALWNPEASLPVAGKIIELDVDWDPTSGTLSRVHRYDGSSLYYKFECVRGHTSPADAAGLEAWLPAPASYASEYSAGAAAESDYDWHKYWLFVGTSASDPTGGGYPAWAAATAYTSLEAVVTVSTADYSAGDITPSALPVEYVGHATVDDSEIAPLLVRDVSPPVEDPWQMDTYAPDGTGAWDIGALAGTPTLPASNGLLNDAPAFAVTAFTVSYAAPSGSVPGENPSLTLSPLLATPRWGAATDLAYYLVYEHDHGGFSEPKLLFTASAADPELTHTAVAIQFWADLSDWAESVRRVHVFRVDSATKTDVWLFAADRETSSWITTGGAATYWMLAPVATGAVYAAATFTGYGQGGRMADVTANTPDGAAGYVEPGFMGFGGGAAALARQRTAITRAFLAVADGGLNLTPAIKGGAGIFSFVDYGQDSGESATTIMGSAMHDLVDASTKRYYDLELVGFAQGRAFYTSGGAADGGTVYFSVAGRYSVIDPLNFFYFKNSGPLAAVEGVGSYIIFLFESKVVVIDARSGIDTGWSVVLELEGVGCDSADLVARHESLVFWAGGGSVWLWTGAGRPQRISERIEYPGFAEDMKTAAAAWMFVDPVRRELLLHLRKSAFANGWGARYFTDSLAGAEVRGKCLTFAIETGAWCTETLRSLASATDDGYKVLGRPFALGNYVLIPVATVGASEYDYLVVRQAYQKLLAGAVVHEPLLPPWKRAVMETGFMDLGASGVEKKPKRLYPAFTAPLLYGAVATGGISADIADHWTLEMFTYSARRGSLLGGSPWESLEAATPVWVWTPAAESGGGYSKSIYALRSLPRKPTNYVAFRLVSQGAEDYAIWTDGKKYRCILPHTATADNSPGGVDHATYWDAGVTATAADLLRFRAWVLGAQYGVTYETRASKVELGALEMSFAPKAVR